MMKKISSWETHTSPHVLPPSHTLPSYTHLFCLHSTLPAYLTSCLPMPLWTLSGRLPLDLAAWQAAGVKKNGRNACRKTARTARRVNDAATGELGDKDRRNEKAGIHIRRGGRRAGMGGILHQALSA